MMSGSRKHTRRSINLNEGIEKELATRYYDTLMAILPVDQLDGMEIYDIVDQYGKQIAEYIEEQYQGDYGRTTELLFQYVNQLEQRYNLTYTEDPDMNVIDVVPLQRRSFTDLAFYNRVSLYQLECPFYAYIPCFSSGVAYFREHYGYMWNIQELDLDRYRSVIKVVAYTNMKASNWISQPIPYMVGTITIQGIKEKDRNGELVLSRTKIGFDCISPEELYQQIPSEELNWTKADEMLWRQSYVRFIREISSGFQNPERPTDPPGLVLLYDFVIGIAMVNMILHEEKRSTRKRTTKVIQIADFNQTEQDRRKVHVIDGVRFVSKRRPRESTLPNLRRYQVAKWTVRGHTRTLASGKVTYVREHENRRKCLRAEAEVVQSAKVTIEDKHTHRTKKEANANG